MPEFPIASIGSNLLILRFILCEHSIKGSTINDLTYIIMIANSIILLLLIQRKYSIVKMFEWKYFLYFLLTHILLMFYT